MKKLSWVVMAMGLGAFACQSGGATSAGGDTDSDASCGSVDEECCVGSCDATCTAVGCDTTPSECCCYLVCEPDLCTDDDDAWEAEAVFCGDVSDGGGIGACFAEEDADPIEEGCEDSTLPCTTASGYTDGVCLYDSADNAYCMRACTPGNDVCDALHSCGALIDTTNGEVVGGACLPI